MERRISTRQHSFTDGRDHAALLLERAREYGFIHLTLGIPRGGCACLEGSGNAAPAGNIVTHVGSRSVKDLYDRISDCQQLPVQARWRSFCQ
jgi:hypothetical protein